MKVLHILDLVLWGAVLAGVTASLWYGGTIFIGPQKKPHLEFSTNGIQQSVHQFFAYRKARKEILLRFETELAHVTEQQNDEIRACGELSPERRVEYTKYYVQCCYRAEKALSEL